MKAKNNCGQKCTERRKNCTKAIPGSRTVRKTVLCNRPMFSISKFPYRKRTISIEIVANNKSIK